MADKEAVFLTYEEAVSAILIDFRQYAPQIPLFLRIYRAILSPETMVTEDFRRGGLWASEHGRRSPYPIAPDDFRERLCRTLEKHPPPPGVLVDLCRAVFETDARIGRDGADDGIWIETDMEQFRCRQCGRCCRELDYHDQLTETDFALWERRGRTDIMEWVQLIRSGGRVVACTIWVDPETGIKTVGCPWLKRVPGSGRLECQIHEVKPEICRQYPGSRKHARMTGCIGFDETMSRKQ